MWTETAAQNSIWTVSQIRKWASGGNLPDGGQTKAANKLRGHVKDLLIKINLLIVYLDYAKSLSENSKTFSGVAARNTGLRQGGPWEARNARDASSNWTRAEYERQMGLKLFYFFKPTSQQNGQREGWVGKLRKAVYGPWINIIHISMFYTKLNNLPVDLGEARPQFPSSTNLLD